MSLLVAVKDIILGAGGDWDLVSIDFTDQLLSFSLGANISVFSQALDEVKDLYGVTSTEIDALNQITEPTISEPILSVEKADIFEYRDIWAEEGSTATANSSEWSYGNGATGFMGLPIESGWEVQAMYFHADTYPATGTIQVDLMNYGDTPSNAAGNTIAELSLSSSVDGGGATNNAYKYLEYPTAIPIPTTGGGTTIGFLTRTVTGTISDVRIGAKLRRKIGEYVSDVTIS